MVPPRIFWRFPSKKGSILAELISDDRSCKKVFTSGFGLSLTFLLCLRIIVTTHSLLAGSLLFRHFGNDTAQMRRSVALYILPPAGNLLVLPDVALTAAGPTSGPFRPASFEFTLINAGGSSLFWTANINPDSDWLDLFSADGNPGPLGTNVITIQPNAKAAKLGVGTNATQITFVDVSNLQNSVTRQFVLEIYPFSFAAFTLAISSGDFTASLHGVPGWSYVIESSTNLSDWTRLITNTASTVNGSLSFTDPKAGDLDPRFYRARSFP